MTNRNQARPSAWLGVIGFSFALMGAGVVSAELQRVEAVGIFGIREAARARVVPRDEAVAMARWEGVSRVALELIGESTPGDSMDPDGDPDADPSTQAGLDSASAGAQTDPDAMQVDRVAELRKALGKDLLPYMRSYRIIEDRGEVPVLFDEDPDVTVEYVVVVEVIVDVDRVTSALERAGLIARTEPGEVGEPVLVELVGLSRYEAFEVVLAALRDELGATRIETVEFSPERQVLSVEVPFGPDVLSARLASFENERVLLEPLGVDLVGRRIRMLGRWFPAAPAPEGSEIGSRRAPAS